MIFTHTQKNQLNNRREMDLCFLLVGMFERVDRCCREHDHCEHIIHPFTVNFGVFNPTLFTISHCDCDYR